jgi:glycosyltransferase involved in cell wall biosynthesis
VVSRSYRPGVRPSRILYVSSCWPHGRTYGSQLRALHIGRALQHFGRPTLAVVGAEPAEQAAIDRTAAEFDLARVIPVVSAPVRGLRHRVRSVLDPDFTNIHGLAASAEDEAWLVDAQRQFDLIWFFKLRTANFFANARWPRSVVDIDDVPSTMERTLARSAPSFTRRARSRLRTLELRRHENHLDQRFSVLAVCSQADRDGLHSSVPVHVIPNGFARPAQDPVPAPVTPPRIGFVGLFSYVANSDGVRWFVDSCWERIKQQIPGVRLRLVGTGTDGPLKPIEQGIDGLGWVEDPAAEIASWSLMIVPIRTGAGTRVKIPDAFSRKCPLVSTRLGAYGYDVTDGRELRLADDPTDFAAACVDLIRKPAEAAAMADRAYRAFLEQWTWEAITPKVWAAVEDCLRRASR